MPLAVAIALVAASPAAATMYVYESASGTRMVSNHPVSEPGYRLIHRSASVRDVGAVAAGRKRPDPRPDTSSYDTLIRRTAMTLRLDPALLKAVIHAESSFNPTAVSRKGASGLMQLMPETARRYGVLNLFDPAQNVSGGARHLKGLLMQYNYDHRLALAAYNAGEEAVSRYRGVPPYPETQRYVRKVLLLKNRYSTKYR